MNNTFNSNGAVAAVELFNGKNGVVMSKLAFAFGGVDILPWAEAREKYGPNINAYTVIFDNSEHTPADPIIQLWLKDGYRPMANVYIPNMCVCKENPSLGTTMRIEWDRCDAQNEVFRLLAERARKYGLKDNILWMESRFPTRSFESFVKEDPHIQNINFAMGTGEMRANHKEDSPAARRLQKRRHREHRENSVKKNRQRNRLMASFGIDDLRPSDTHMSKNYPDGFVRYHSWHNRVVQENHSNSYKVKRPIDRRRLDACKRKIDDFYADAENIPESVTAYEEKGTMDYDWFQYLKRRLESYGNVSDLGVRETLFLASKLGIEVDHRLFEENVYYYDYFGQLTIKREPISLGNAAHKILAAIYEDAAWTYWD